MTLKFFILKDRQVVPATMEEWSRFLMSPERIVAVWEFAEGSVTVSTVFLGLDHMQLYRPVGYGLQVFETMVFGGPLDQYQERSSTWQEAEQIHERVCAMVTKRVLQ
jgi:hypothetical protein